MDKRPVGAASRTFGVHGVETEIEVGRRVGRLFPRIRPVLVLPLPRPGARSTLGTAKRQCAYGPQTGSTFWVRHYRTGSGLASLGSLDGGVHGPGALADALGGLSGIPLPDARHPPDGAASPDFGHRGSDQAAVTRLDRLTFSGHGRRSIWRCSRRSCPMLPQLSRPARPGPSAVGDAVFGRLLSGPVMVNPVGRSATLAGTAWHEQRGKRGRSLMVVRGPTETLDRGRLLRACCFPRGARGPGHFGSAVDWSAGGLGLWVGREHPRATRTRGAGHLDCERLGHRRDVPRGRLLGRAVVAPGHRHPVPRSWALAGACSRCWDVGGRVTSRNARASRRARSSFLPGAATAAQRGLIAVKELHLHDPCWLRRSGGHAAGC